MKASSVFRSPLFVKGADIGTTKTLAEADLNKCHQVTAGVVVTIPTPLTMKAQAGDMVMLFNSSAAGASVALGAGASFLNHSGSVPLTPGVAVLLVAYSDSAWTIQGIVPATQADIVAGTDVKKFVNAKEHLAFHAADIAKLAGIEAGAEANVQADWNAASGADGFIANKPTLGTAAALNIQTDRYDGSQGIPAMCGAFGFGLTAGVYSGNLNDITKTSIYYCDGNSLNRPININGWLETLVYATTGYAVQRYWANGTSWCSVRYQTGGTWSAWTSLGGSGFLAMKSAAQVLAAATMTKIIFDVESYDDASAFVNSTFTVKYTGRCVFYAGVLINAGTDGQANYLYIRKNGSMYIGGAYSKQSGASDFLNCHIITDCAAGDTIECFAQVGASGEISNTAHTKFWGARL